MERGKRPKIELTVTGKLGTMGCHRGHHIGETFDYDTDRGKICPMAMHCAFPYIGHPALWRKPSGPAGRGSGILLLRCRRGTGV